MGADISLESCTFTPEPEAVDKRVLLGLVIFWICFFGANFSLSWRLMDKYWPRFRLFDASKKGDNASRVNSTLHAALVSPTLLYALRRMEWGPFMEPLQPPYVFQACFTISMGYFISDFFVLWKYHTPMWKVFMLHHVMAMMPYLVYLFAKPCAVGVQILACYMLVELTNLTYNAKLWMEDIGNTRSKWYSFLLYTSAIEWLIFRNFGPGWSVYMSHRKIIPYAPNAVKCLGPGVVGGYFVNLFCAVAFYAVFVTEIRDRWQGKGSWAVGEAYEKAHNGKPVEPAARKTTASRSRSRSRSQSKGRKASANGRRTRAKKQN